MEYVQKILDSNKMPQPQSEKIAEESVEVNPERDLVVPMGLYQNDVESDPLSLLVFPVRKEEGWGFQSERDGMFLRKVFYVFSPSVTPLPPLTKLMYTTERNYQPSATTGIQTLFDSFDIKKLRDVSANSNRTDKLGLVFGAYLNPVAGTFPLYFFTRRVTDGTLTYASLFSEPPVGSNINPANDTIERGLEWQPRFGGKSPQAPTVSPIFVMTERPQGFSMKGGLCLPCSKSTDSIDQCLQKLVGNLTDLSRRGVNMVDEEIGFPRAPVYRAGKAGQKVAAAIEKIISDGKDTRQPDCPCPVAYAAKLREVKLEKRAFVAGLSLAMFFCILIISVVAWYVSTTR